jgi:hypothetical protein
MRSDCRLLGLAFIMLVTITIAPDIRAATVNFDYTAVALNCGAPCGVITGQFGWDDTVQGIPNTPPTAFSTLYPDAGHLSGRATGGVLDGYQFAHTGLHILINNDDPTFFFGVSVDFLRFTMSLQGNLVDYVAFENFCFPSPGGFGVCPPLDSQNFPIPGTLVHGTWNAGEILSVRGVPPSGTLLTGQDYMLTSVREALSSIPNPF